MDDTCTTLAFDTEADEDGDGWQVVRNEVRSTIERIYPDTSVSSTEGFEGLYRALNFIQFVVRPQDFVDEGLPLLVLLVQVLNFEEFTDLVCD